MTIKASNYPTIRPTLNLDFAKSKQLDPRITFSRASSATYVDANGLIQSAASGAARFDHSPTTGESLGLLVEESRTNYVKYSQNIFSYGSTELDKWNIIDQTVAGWPTPGHGLGGPGVGTFVPFALMAPNGTFTASYFNAIGVNYLRSPYITSGNNSQVLNALTVNLNTGTITSTGSNAAPSSIVNVGNGWYRIIWNGGNTSIGNSSTCSIYAKAGETGILNLSYVAFFGGMCMALQTGGTAGQGVYVWGAQIEVGSFPTSYIPTPATFTSRASTATYYNASGVIQTAAINIARSAAYFPDSNGVFRPAGLLLEAAGTNYVTSSDFSSAPAWWQQEGVVRSADTSITNPAGTTAGIVRITATSANSGHGYGIEGLDSLCTNNALVTWSVYVKKGNHRYISIGAAGPGDYNYQNLQFDFDTETVSGGSFQKLPNGWYRLVTTIGSRGGGGYGVYRFPVFLISSMTTSGSPWTPTGNEFVYLWGPQAEIGSLATSYIPTAGSTVTRSADVSSSATVTRSADVAQITGTNFSSWYNGSSFTFLTIGRTGPGIVQATNMGNGYLNLAAGSRLLYVNLSEIATYDGTNKTFLTTSNQSSTHKMAVGISTGSQIIAVDGSLSGSSTNNGVYATATSLGIGTAAAPLCGTLSRLTYWPTRLSDATLQTITQ